MWFSSWCCSLSSRLLARLSSMMNDERFNLIFNIFELLYYSLLLFFLFAPMSATYSQYENGLKHAPIVFFFLTNGRTHHRIFRFAPFFRVGATRRTEAAARVRTSRSKEEGVSFLGACAQLLRLPLWLWAPRPARCRLYQICCICWFFCSPGSNRKYAIGAYRICCFDFATKSTCLMFVRPFVNYIPLFNEMNNEMCTLMVRFPFSVDCQSCFLFWNQSDLSNIWKLLSIFK